MKTRIIDMSIKELESALDKSEISSVDIAKSYIAQIEKVDDKIGAYLYINKEAVKQAEALDTKRKNGEKLGRLAGMPIALKDNMCTVDMPTTCASKMMQGYMSPFDAEVVKRLKGEDAIMLGKVNLDEFAMGGSTENSYYKITTNPHDISRVPGGSSGGSAASVVSHQALVALGSDTGGSIRQPASFCGAVGIKPTYGSVSRSGLVAFASSLDQIGPIARNVEDAALTLEVLIGHDAKDSTSVKFEKPSYETEIKKDIKGMKIALPREFFEQGVQIDVKESILKCRLSE